MFKVQITNFINYFIISLVSGLVWEKVSGILIMLLINNFSPKWSWLVVDIYRAAKRQGEYPSLATNLVVNSCFTIY